MSLPPVTLSFDSIEDLSLDALQTPITDTFDKSDDPRSDVNDRSTSPSSDTAEPPGTKEWPLLCFEKFVQHWLKSNDVADIVGNEAVIMEKYQDYKKDFELVKPILDTLIRLSVDNHETTHQMAHGMISNLSLGHPLLTLNPAWVKREGERTAAAAAAKAEEERRKAEEEREKAEAEAKARAKGATDLLARIDATISKARANAKSKNTFATPPLVEKFNGKESKSTTKPADKLDNNKAVTSTDTTTDKAADDNADEKSAKPKEKKKFVPYVPKYLLDVHSRKYCMNDTLVTRGGVGDPSIVSCLGASAHKCQARVTARNSKAVRSGRTPLIDRRPAKSEDGGSALVTVEGLVGHLKNIESTYPDGIDGSIAEVVEAMMWM